MRAFSTALVVCAALLAGSAAAEECSGSITAEEVLRAEDARYAAQIANDFAAMEQMFGPELVYIRSVDGAVADKRAYIESMRSGTVKYRAMRRSDVRVRTYGCLAMITGLFELDLTVSGRDLSEQSRFHSVWAKRGQGMQFVSWQSTRVPPKQ
jgi:ketosteroid isomerase-like protein